MIIPYKHIACLPRSRVIPTITISSLAAQAIIAVAFTFVPRRVDSIDRVITYVWGIQQGDGEGRFAVFVWAVPRLTFLRRLPRLWRWYPLLWLAEQECYPEGRDMRAGRKCL